jgi:hypothetical protein
MHKIFIDTNLSIHIFFILGSGGCDYELYIFLNCNAMQ